MKKQTAVEWYWNEIAEILPHTVDSQTAIKLYEAFQQAKAMEREQIVKAWEYGCMTNYGDAQTYYNETYKGGEQ